MDRPKRSKGTLPMPRYQSCPKGHPASKRIRRLVGGADYYCNICKETFFIRRGSK